MKKVIKNLLVIFIITAFMSFTVACEKTVTKYDSQGKPYTDKEFSAWETLGAIFLGAIILGAIASSSNKNNGNDGTFLYEEGTLYASLNNHDVINDALQNASNHTKWIQVVDPKGNMISRHLIDLDALRFNIDMLDLSMIQLSSEINKEAFMAFMRSTINTNELRSMPSAIRTDVSFTSDNHDVITINSVDILPESKVFKGDIPLLVGSEHGYYHVISRTSEKIESISEELRHVKVIVSPIS